MVKKRAPETKYCIVAVDHLTDMTARALTPNHISTVGGYSSLALAEWNEVRSRLVLHRVLCQGTNSPVLRTRTERRGAAVAHHQGLNRLARKPFFPLSPRSTRSKPPFFVFPSSFSRPAFVRAWASSLTRARLASPVHAYPLLDPLSSRRVLRAWCPSASHPPSFCALRWLPTRLVLPLSLP